MLASYLLGPLFLHPVLLRALFLSSLKCIVGQEVFLLTKQFCFLQLSLLVRIELVKILHIIWQIRVCDTFAAIPVVDQDSNRINFANDHVVIGLPVQSFENLEALSLRSASNLGAIFAFVIFKGQIYILELFVRQCFGEFFLGQRRLERNDPEGLEFGEEARGFG